MGSGSGKLEAHDRGAPELGVAEGGFGSYVKTYKPWFIGREAFLEGEKTRRGEVVRFRFNEKGVRMAHPADPVMDSRGKVTGWVTSCAVDSQGYLTGLAYVELKNADEGTAFYIYQGAPEALGKSPVALKVGDKSILPSLATIISRFPK
jgi:glycine hydroxymethyltransferase